MARVSIWREMGICSRFGMRIITIRCGHTCRRNAGILKNYLCRQDVTRSTLLTTKIIIMKSEFHLSVVQMTGLSFNLFRLAYIQWANQCFNYSANMTTYSQVI